MNKVVLSIVGLAVGAATYRAVSGRAPAPVVAGAADGIWSWFFGEKKEESTEPMQRGLVDSGYAREGVRAIKRASQAVRNKAEWDALTEAEQFKAAYPYEASINEVDCQEPSSWGHMVNCEQAGFRGTGTRR